MGQYDELLRRTFLRSPASLLRLAGVQLPSSPTGSPPPQITHLTTEFPDQSIRADAVLSLTSETTTRIFHVEHQLSAEASKIHPRLVGYWHRITQTYGEPPEQHVFVLSRAGGRLPGVYQRGRLELAYEVHHLWELPGASFTAEPDLLPLMCLTDALETPDTGSTSRATSVPRTEALERAAELISFVPDLLRRRSLAEDLSVLANIYWPKHTISSILRRFDMPVDFSSLEIVQDAVRDGRQKGLAEGRREGRQEGRQEGRREGLAEGLAEGRLTGKRQAAIQLLGAKFSLATIDLDGLDDLKEHQLDALLAEQRDFEHASDFAAWLTTQLPPQ